MIRHFLYIMIFLFFIDQCSTFFICPLSIYARPCIIVLTVVFFSGSFERIQSSFECNHDFFERIQRFILRTLDLCTGSFERIQSSFECNHDSFERIQRFILRTLDVCTGSFERIQSSFECSHDSFERIQKFILRRLDLCRCIQIWPAKIDAIQNFLCFCIYMYAISDMDSWNA